MEDINSTEPAYAEPQRQVQRWLGRCMLSLQQSERLLKALLHEVDVTAIHTGRAGEGAAAFEVSRAFEKERLVRMTLGGLVSAFFGDVVTNTEASFDTKKEREVPDDRMSMQFSFRQAIPSGAFEELQASMREMVGLRNEWVHHLVDRFDLTSLEGCALALESLQAGYDKAERFRVELQSIGKGMVEAKEHLASYFASPQGQAVLLGSKIPVESTPLLGALRDAVEGAAPASDGTVLLSAVLEKLSSLHPHEKPESYGYVSWPQVIHESSVFGMVRHDAEGRKIPPRLRLIGSTNRG